MGGPGGRAPGHGATIFFKRFPPRIVSVRGPCKNFARGTPLCYETCERGGVWPNWWPGWALTGSGRCAANFARVPPPGFCVSGGGLQTFSQGSPPLLQGVREGGAGWAGGPGGRSPG